MWMLPQRTIYMDGRARPSAYAQHTWQGFSTGEWEGDMLKVTTTHLKEGWLRRNGVPRSEKATLVEYFIRHGGYLTLVTVVKDPVYLTEAFVRTSNWVADPGFQLSPFSCIPTVEIERRRDEVPHHLPDANPYLTEFAAKHGLPSAAARGGGETMYPEFAARLRAAAAREVSTGRAVCVALPVATVLALASAADAARRAERPRDAAGAGQCLRAHGPGRQHDRPDWREGPLVVDTQPAALSERVLAAIRGLTPRPIRHIVLTSGSDQTPAARPTCRRPDDTCV